MKTALEMNAAVEIVFILVLLLSFAPWLICAKDRRLEVKMTLVQNASAHGACKLTFVFFFVVNS